MPAEFIDILKMEELDIGHSKKVLFSSDHFHTWVHGDYPDPTFLPGQPPRLKRLARPPCCALTKQAR